MEEQLLATLDAAKVRDALGCLGENARRALILAYYGGYTQNEIAALTNAPLGTVKSRMRNGLLTLRRTIGEEPPATVAPA